MSSVDVRCVFSLHSPIAMSYVNVNNYPHMPISKVWIYRLLFACFCLFVCLFVCLYGYGFLRRG